MANANDPLFEKYAVQLLMCSPSTLSRTWTDCKEDEIEAKVGEQLKKLPLSETAQTTALRLMVRLKGERAFFKGIADLFKASLYAGSEPHPTLENAAKIIAKLQELDRHHSDRHATTQKD